nr:copia protein [Tanacetum cinerariifolium]
MNYQPVTAGNQSNPSTGNTDGDVAFKDKEHEFEGRKPESEVYVSLSNSAQSRKHDDKTRREAKGKRPIESSTGYRNLSAEFEDFSNNSINEVNAADSLVLVVGQISTNSTNNFNADGPSNTSVSPTHGKYSYVNTSQYPDDLNMPELEDITYYDDEEDVGAEADFTNLETTITVSPIPTTRVHKDHYVTQIIGDLYLATQTRSMIRVAKDQVARIESIRLFLAYALFMGFMVYQMDVKSTFLYETIEEEVYVCKPPGFENPDYSDKKQDGIFISQDKYVAEILRKFGLTDETSASTPIDTEKPLLKDPDVAYSDSDYDGASLDKKSTTGGCQFLGCRLIFWQCKKQTVIATSSIKAGVNTSRCDEDMLELMELMVFLLPSWKRLELKFVLLT